MMGGTASKASLLCRGRSMNVYLNVATRHKSRLASKYNIKTHDYKRLLSLARPEKWKIAGAVGLLFVSSGVTMSVPFCLGKVLDIIYSMDSSSMKKNLRIVCSVLVAVFLIGGVANAGRVYLITAAGSRISQRLRKDVFSAIMKQEVGFFDKNKTGELINRLSADANLVAYSVTNNVSDGLRSLTMIGAGVTMMFCMSSKLALLGLSIVPPVAGCAIIYGRYVRKLTKRTQDCLASATQVAQERISNIRTVRAFAKEVDEQRRYNYNINNVLELSYKEAKAKSVFFGLMGLSGNLIALSVLYFGGSMVTESQLTIGQLSSFILYAAYVGMSLGTLSSFFSEAMKSLGATTRLWELLDRPPAIPLIGGIIPSREPQGNIEFKNIYFSYPNRPEVQVYRDFNLKVDSGKITAVVGTSGSGKSTLYSLLLRYYQPNSGSIHLDNVCVTQLCPQWLRNSIGTVSQEAILFSGSIRDNIIYGTSEEVSDDVIMEAADKANALSFITELPRGLDSVVGERGVMLSGGQKQRVAIARAIIKNPNILLLDEATSALDAESEHMVQEAIERVMQNRTVIVIAHRLSTIRNADEIAVLGNGSVMELGTYDQLMKIEGGLFKKLVERQSIVNK